MFALSIIKLIISSLDFSSAPLGAKMHCKACENFPINGIYFVSSFATKPAAYGDASEYGMSIEVEWLDTMMGTLDGGLPISPR